MGSKKPLILALVLFNAALVGLLVVLHGGSAQAQVVPGAVGRFAAVTQTIDSDESLVWVLDTVSRRLVVYRLDRDRGRLHDVKRFPLRDVFRLKEQPEKPGRGVK
ncbi:MAG: hypothetical protein AMS14_08890 [Planctomycetes bacterium DG_20]|nr:MAG: hypothetical protein AMS14_08890 [Planctomycetes bacterium DG_20]